MYDFTMDDMIARFRGMDLKTFYEQRRMLSESLDKIEREKSNKKLEISRKLNEKRKIHEENRAMYAEQWARKNLCVDMIVKVKGSRNTLWKQVKRIYTFKSDIYFEFDCVEKDTLNPVIGRGSYTSASKITHVYDNINKNMVPIHDGM